MKYVVNLSGGLTSAWALKCAIEQKGKENTDCYFADTRGKRHVDNSNAGEDADSYRFIRDLSKHFEIPIWRVADGRDIWEVMRDERCITIPQQDFTPCSKALKAETLDNLILAKYDLTQLTQVFGMQWYEGHRMGRLKSSLPCAVWFPLAERPFMEKEQIAEWFESVGIKRPRLYELGFEHNNCGGFCVRAGKAHFARLYFTLPDRFKYHAQKELDLIAYLGKTVTVLREKIKGETHLLTLHEFGERLEAAVCRFPELLTLDPKEPKFGQLLKQAMKNFDPNDFGACGCFLAGAESNIRNTVV